MNRLKIALLGPRTNNKLKILNKLTNMDLFIRDNYEGYYSNILDFTIIYDLSEEYREIGFRNYKPVAGDGTFDIIKARSMESLDFLYSKKFIRESREITVELPLRKDLIFENNIVNRIEIIDNRGFLTEHNVLDISNINRKNTKEYKVDVILFSLHDYISWPDYFSIMLYNRRFRNGLSPYFSLIDEQLKFTNYEKLEMKNRVFIRERILKDLKMELMGYMVWKNL